MRLAIDYKEFGEAYHIALVLKCDDRSTAFVVYDKDKNEREVKNKIDFLEALFPGRITSIKRSTYDDLDSEKYFDNLTDTASFVCDCLEKKKLKTNDFKNFIFEKISNKARKEVDRFLSRFTFPKKVVLLWIRSRSYKPERCSTIPGLIKLKDKLIANKYSPILIGPYIDGIEKLISEDDIHLIDFFKDTTFGSDTYFKQLYFFDSIRKNIVAQIGMMSGAMDGPAFIGIPTIWFARTSQHDKEVQRIKILSECLPRYEKLEIKYWENLRFLDHSPEELENLIRKLKKI